MVQSPAVGAAGSSAATRWRSPYAGKPVAAPPRANTGSSACGTLPHKAAATSSIPGSRPGPAQASSIAGAGVPGPQSAA